MDKVAEATKEFSHLIKILKAIINKILFILIKSEKKKLFLLIVASIAVSIADIGFLALLLFVINFYTTGKNPFHHHFISENIFNKNSLTLIFIFFILFLLKNIAGYFIIRAQYKFVYKVASRISSTNMLKYLEGNFSDFINIDSSVQIRKISQQPIEFSQYILAGSQQIITEFILILLALIAILIFNAKLFFLLFALLLPAILIISFITKRRLKSVRKNVKTTGEITLQYLQETLAGFAESNVFEKNNYFTNKYSASQQNLNHCLSELQATQAIPSRLIEVFAVLGLFILIVLNKFLPTHFYTSELVTLGAFMAAAYKIIPGIVKISNTSGQIKTFDFTLNDLVQQQNTSLKVKNINPVKTINSISFNNVYYETQSRQVLQEFNMHLQSGDFTCLTGASGNGKTTIINLLLGFLKQQHGKIFINDKLTTSDERYHYHKNISYVKQQPFLIHDSIINNITLGETTYDVNEINTLINICGLDDLIMQSENGLQKIISENGKNISGGQRQRIALARALYKNADVIILDEPFNELDEASEFLLLKHFKTLADKGKIIILVTHNSNSVAFCNKIISLEEINFCETNQ